MKPQINDRHVLMDFIKHDYYRTVGHWPGLFPALLHMWRNRTSPEAFLFWFRIAQWGGNPFLLAWAKWRLRHIAKIRNIDIPPSTRIGKGLYCGHFMCIVINPTAVIGDNCNLSQFLSIGANDGTAAHIGNNVYIGPHVSIVENVRIGNNVTIGAGAVVTHDIPENATAAGVPARVLNYDRPARYIGRRSMSFKKANLPSPLPQTPQLDTDACLNSGIQ